MFEAEDAMKPETLESEQVVKRARKASKETRRLQLIEATIDSLAKRGYSDTTMADVADRAGLSRGIVNFHFESKEKLLIATLQHMSEEYAAHWRGALEKAGDNPADRLKALVDADFERSICNQRKIAAWCAFWGEAKSRPTYQALCSARDETYQDVLAELCGALIEEGGYDADIRMTAMALDVLLEGLWLRLMLSNGRLKREAALEAGMVFLRGMFPKHYPAIPAPDT